MKFNLLSRSFWIGAFSGWACVVSMVCAQDFPNRPIRLIVPFAPGGPTDLMARTLGKHLGPGLNQQVLVDNKPGGGGLIGFGELMKAPPDGHTVVFPSIQAVTNPALVPNFPYDLNKDFLAVTVIGFIPHILVVRADSPFKTLADLVAHAREKPDSLTYASSGNGTSAHLAGAMFADRAGIRVTHVPYRGASPAMQDLLAGQTHYMFLDSTGALAQIRAGKLRALAIAPARRIQSLPDVPSIAEQGYPGFDIRAWYGLLVRAGTSAATVQALYEETRKALAQPELRELFRSQGIEPGGISPADFSQMIREDLLHWRRIIDKLKIKAE